MLLIIRRVLLTLLIVLSFIVIVLAILWRTFTTTPLLRGHNEIIYVPPGSTINSVTRTLTQRGLIKHPKLFMYLAHFKGQDRTLKAGEYLIKSGSTAPQLLIQLVKGKVILRRFTIVEGWTLKQVIAAINGNPYLSHTLNQISQPEFSEKIGINQLNYEGQFYPDTYLFAAGVADTVILKKAFWIMQHSLQKVWAQRAPNLPYSDPYTALIVASLIEKETARPEERSKIAGVIVRRLQNQMLLQIDASVIYGLGDQYRGKLTRNDLKIDTAYNTYMHKGLPPTPIAMPSLPSIVAALHPEVGTALYYVAKGDGSHEFTNNLNDHHLAVARYHVDFLRSEPESKASFPWFDQLTPEQVNKIIQGATQ